MLTLRRERGQSLMFRLPSGERVTVQVLALSPSEVRLGIAAPRDVTILRGELDERDALRPDPIRLDDAPDPSLLPIPWEHPAFTAQPWLLWYLPPHLIAKPGSPWVWLNGYATESEARRHAKLWRETCPGDRVHVARLTEVSAAQAGGLADLPGRDGAA